MFNTDSQDSSSTARTAAAATLKMLRLSPNTRVHICPLCKEFGRRSHFGPVLRHIGAVHSFQPNFKITCNFCPPSQARETYTNFGAFKRHIYKKHRDEACFPLGVHPTPSALPSAADEPAEAEDITVQVLYILYIYYCVHQQHNGLVIMIILQAPVLETEAEQDESPVEKSDSERAAALFVLRSMEVHKISQVF